MKKWYCPHCNVFKRFKRTVAGVMGYDDTYYCRCCGTELINAKQLLEYRDMKYIQEYVNKRKDEQDG